MLVLKSALWQYMSFSLTSRTITSTDHQPIEGLRQSVT